MERGFLSSEGEKIRERFITIIIISLSWIK